MNDLFPAAPKGYRFTGEDLVREMQREHGKRIEVYGRAVAEKRMTRDVADRQIAMAAAIIEHLQATAIGKTFAVPTAGS